MPPRLSKRQQRELEELEVLKQASAPPGESDSGEEPGPSQARAGGTFANLFAAQEVEDDEDDEEEESKTTKSKKSKKKKKKAADLPKPTDSVAVKNSEVRQPSPAPISTPSERKALKKARQKEKKGGGEDDIDKVLAELSIHYPASQKISQSIAGKQSLADLFAVSLQNLDAEAELRRFFGAKVVLASKAGESSKGKKGPGPNVKSHLTRPQPTWWAASGREGLSLRQLPDEEAEEKCKRHSWEPMQEKWWTVEYSKKYKSMTKAFMDTVLSGDPQGFWDLLGALPWHADTLLQLSEVYRHREEHSQATDFIDRALFAYERSFVGSFNFTTGLNRLDFDHVENRPFFLAVHRQVTDLQRRGCARTSFEFARLLYGLDPWADPHGAALHLEYVALRAGMHQWLLDVFDAFTDRRKSEGNMKGRLDPSLLPGWAYSRALALKISEDARKTDHTESSKALIQAINDFPSVLPLLADKLDASIPTTLRTHRDFKIVTDSMSLSQPAAVMHLLSHLYTQRSFSLWKEHTEWFSDTVTTAFASLPSTFTATETRNAFLAQYQDKNLCQSAYRHVALLDNSYRRLYSFIPREVSEAKSLSCDPLPPNTRVSEYDAAFFSDVEQLWSGRRTRRQRAMDERRLAQMIPDGVFRRQLQAFFDAQPNLAARFPGGILQFAQAVGQLPPDALEDMMLVEAMNQGQGLVFGGDMPQGGMPGGFGNEAMFDPAVEDPPEMLDAELESGEEDELDEDEEDVSPMPRAIRNLLGRFFGRGAPPEESSSDEGDDSNQQPVDDMGVD